MFKAEAEGLTVAGEVSLVHNTQQSLGPGGRRLKAVDSGADNLFGDDDEEDQDAAKRRAREYGGEGDMDEVVYEEDFADDEEKMEMEDTNDQEAKELEVRQLRTAFLSDYSFLSLGTLEERVQKRK